MNTMRWMAAGLVLAALTTAAQSRVPARVKGETVITSGRLEFDYKESVVLFEENVHVVDPQFDLTADRVLIFLEGTNDVRQVRAMGNVRLTSADRTATCNQAVYTRATGQIVMTGEAMLQRANDQIWGKQITIWVNDERMECIPARMVIQPATRKGGANKP